MSMILILTYESFVFYRPDKNMRKPGNEVWTLLKISAIPIKERGGARPVWLSVLPPKLCISHIWPCQSPSAMAEEISTSCPWEVPESETNRRAEQTREGEVKLHLKSRALLERNLRPETSTHLHGGTGIIQGETDLSHCFLWEKKWGFSLWENRSLKKIWKKGNLLFLFPTFRGLPLSQPWNCLKTSNIKGSHFYKDTFNYFFMLLTNLYISICPGGKNATLNPLACQLLYF